MGLEKLEKSFGRSLEYSSSLASPDKKGDKLTVPCDHPIMANRLLFIKNNGVEMFFKLV